MARPTKASDARRDDQITIRVTPDERARLEQAADFLGITPSEFIRRSALGYQIRPAMRRQQTDALAATALLRLGVNLNQLTKHANAGRGLPYRGMLDELIGRINSELDALYGSGDQQRRTHV